MSSENVRPLAATAILAITEVKTAAEAFDRGDVNLFDALDAIVVAVEMFQAATRHQGHREAA